MQSPGTPGRRRRSSGFSARLARTASHGSIPSPHNRTHSRNVSNQSLFSPSTPRPPSSLDHSGDFSGLGDLRSPEGNGLGSLADELAEEEWDGEEAVEQDYGVDALDDEFKAVTLGSPTANHANALSPAFEPETPSKKSRKTLSDYDGSDYGDDDDLQEIQGISRGLETRMAAIEALARQGTGDRDTLESGVVSRVSEQLRDLSSQANVETQIARLVAITEQQIAMLTTCRLSTAHTAVTGNLSHQSRILTRVTQPLLSPLTAPPDPVTAEEVIEMMGDLLLSLPQPINTALASIHSLHAVGTELLASLSQLGDSLQVARQTTNNATRRLRSATETVEALRRELDEAEEGRQWLENGRWEERLQRREASQACREVVQGFEAVCERWRDRLVQGANTGGLGVSAA